MLTAAGIRKSRKQLMSQLVIIIFASMLLSLGTLAILNLGGYFDSKAGELNSAHALFAFTEQRYNESYYRYLAGRQDVRAIQKDEILIMNTELKMPAGSQTILLMGFDYDNMGAMSQIGLVGDSLPHGENSVYMPYAFQSIGGLSLGSTVTIVLEEDSYDETQKVEYDFTVAGFTEDVLLGTMDMGALGLYFPESVYKRFYGELPEFYRGSLLSVQIDNPYAATAFVDEFVEDALGGENTALFSFGIDTIKMSRTMMSNILAVLLVAFAIIVLIVSLVVIKFRIGNTIEEEMRNYGAMKALGYTSVQIIGSIALQFTVTTVLAAVIGIMLSYPAVNAMSAALASQTSLYWRQGFDAVLSAVCLGIVVLTVTLTAVASALKLKKLPPIAALRGGAAANTLQRNIFPFEFTELPLNFTLAMKTTYVNIKQNILIMLILASVSFALIFSVVVSYEGQDDTYMALFAGQNADLEITVNPKADAAELVEEILGMDGVEKATVCDFPSVLYGGQAIYVTLYPDFKDILNDQTYRGRNPIHPREIVISGVLGEMTGREVGDKITLSLNEKEEEYIIAGFYQNTNYMGRTALMTTEAYRLLQPDYKESNVLVKLSENTDAGAFIEELEELYGDKLENIWNVRETMGIMFSSILGLINALALVIEIVVVLVVIFILLLVVRTLVIRRRQEIGIQKALGFTTLQLMNQIACSFMPVAVLGVTAGCVIGVLTVNDCMGLLFAGMGIMNVDFIIPLPTVAVAAVLLCILTYAVSLIVSVRIRKISAYALLTE